jgi:hypothetical protein
VVARRKLLSLSRIKLQLQALNQSVFLQNYDSSYAFVCFNEIGALFYVQHVAFDLYSAEKGKTIAPN